MGERPNILLITADQQRADTVASLGNLAIRTPSLDRLAHEGTAFTSCYTPSPVCVPARQALVTGLPPHQIGCFDNGANEMPFPSLMERLQALGYQTHSVGKMHFVPDLWRMWGFEGRDTSEELQPITSDKDDFCRFLRESGFGHVDEPHGVRSEMYYIPQPSQLPSPLHNTAWVADRSLNFLERRDRTRPFFLWTSFIKPHPPFEAPTPWNKLYCAADMLPPFRPEGFEEFLTYWNHYQNRYKYRDKGYDEMLIRTIRAMYYACISFIDHQVGRILARLGDDIDNTLIIYTSDHGELLGDYGSFGKRSMLNAAARVPLLVRYPARFVPGARCDTPTTLLDLWPTCLAAAGDAESAVSPEGQNLADIAADTSSRDTVCSQFSEKAKGVYMAATRNLKYVYSAPDNREWLFDLARDPMESHDFAGNPRYDARKRSLKQKLITRFQKDDYLEPLDGDTWRVFAPSRIPENPDALLLLQDPSNLDERLAELDGYVDQ